MTPRPRFTIRELEIIISCLAHATAGEASGGPLDDYDSPEGTPRWERATDRKFQLAGSAQRKAHQMIATRRRESERCPDYAFWPDTDRGQCVLHRGHAGPHTL